MKLINYDKKLVRITDIFGDVFEGYCMHNSSEYNEHEYGKNMDSLQILNMIFYEDIIKNIEIIDDFTTSYSKLEEVIVEDVDSIEDILLDDDEDYEYIYRLLAYLKEYVTKNELNNSYYTNLLKCLIEYSKYHDKDQIRVIVDEIINIINKKIID